MLFYQTKVPCYWGKKLFSKNNFDSVLLILNKQFVHFSYFLSEIFLIHISHTYLMAYGKWWNINYTMLTLNIINVNVDHEKKKLKRNVYNTIRSSLYYEILNLESKKKTLSSYSIIFFSFSYRISDVLQVTILFVSANDSHISLPVHSAWTSGEVYIIA